MLCPKGKLKLGILPVATFASGHTFFVQRMYEKLEQQAYVVHATFQFSGTHGKRHRLREALLWDVDPPEYYDPPGGLLVFKADVPQALLDASNSKEGHFALVNHQIRQVRDALALAQALGRTLVMPSLYCGWDRWWAPHTGKIPNSNLDLPYLCPMVRRALHPRYIHVANVCHRITSLTRRCGLGRCRWPRRGRTSSSGSTACWTTPACPRRASTGARALRTILTVAGCRSAERARVEGIGQRLYGRATLPRWCRCSAAAEHHGAAHRCGRQGRVRVAGKREDPGVWQHAAPLCWLFPRRGQDALLPPRAGVRRYLVLHPRSPGASWRSAGCRELNAARSQGHIWYDLLFDVPHTDRHNRVFNGTFPLLTGP